MSEQTWHDVQWLATHATIRAAAVELRREGKPMTEKTLAARAGVTPRTVGRHFKRPVDALDVNLTEDALVRYLDLVRTRPPEEGSVVAVLRAAVEYTDKEDDADLIGTAQAVAASPGNLLVALDGFLRDMQPALLVILAERGGRAEPNLEDKLAAAALASMSMTALAHWAQDGCRVPLVTVYRAVAGMLGA